MRNCCAGVLAMCLCFFSASGFEVTRDGKPMAEIVVAEAAGTPVKNAAKEFQHWVREISGAELPIVAKPGAMPQRMVFSAEADVLGMFPEDAAKLKGTEGYAVRTRGNTLYLIGAVPKGVLNGAFKLLYNNTDIIWARPNAEFGTAFSSNPSLDFKQTDCLDMPHFLMLGWQVAAGTTDDEFKWCVRNACNWTWNSPKNTPENANWGMATEAYFGHNIVGMYLQPSKYFAEHPDFYPEINGERISGKGRSHGTQLCFSNPEMVKAFIKEFDLRVAAVPKDVEMIGVFAEDNHDRCRCKSCEADIALPDGAALKSNADNFYSTRFFLFLNQIAAHAKVKYPDKKIQTYGYFFT